ncbi:hypothetical protein DFQ11_10386 [Winogradskyella epiphytica]|uniref:Uncharacterized protein n=1 Tax=Winogradskyella epiphytica TaxID=262005 RepID=A0A2V4WVN7_9FLAO|nr:hypothetical protein [Winogradskyella epiphytica]PYE81006.1 hypothetical protein DFQ11_10386 [Winogradskyella epiphytica]GGW66163.1 hypothetical protein GCM10008085_17490 [Winogradskyella epiphytica]
MNDDLKISKRKPTYPISEKLDAYLSEYRRNIDLPIFYSDLLRFQGSVVVYDQNDEDTLWVRVYYNDYEREEIDISLKQVYSNLISDGGKGILKYLSVDAIDFCTFGNSKPFRVKVRNILNDNYTYFYVKTADASRVYGLELEQMLSPYQINFLVCGDTLIEEHIAGIPGDVFINTMLPDCNESEKAQIAKEFVKFNERCLIRLLGDMRSYNYVIVPTHDFDHVVFKIRAIDFDQQCYEGNFKIYKPQFFKENYKMVELVGEKIQNESIDQYKIEERSIVAKRMISYHTRLNALLDCMVEDEISIPKHIEMLKEDIYEFTMDLNFRKSENMGEILRNALDFVKRNYEDVSLKRFL